MDLCDRKLRRVPTRNNSGDQAITSSETSPSAADAHWWWNQISGWDSSSQGFRSKIDDGRWWVCAHSPRIKSSTKKSVFLSLVLWCFLEQQVHLLYPIFGSTVVNQHVVLLYAAFRQHKYVFFFGFFFPILPTDVLLMLEKKCKEVHSTPRRQWERETRILKRSQSISSKIFIEVINHTARNFFSFQLNHFRERQKAWLTDGESYSDSDDFHHTWRLFSLSFVDDWLWLLFFFLKKMMLTEWKSANSCSLEAAKSHSLLQSFFFSLFFFPTSPIGQGWQFF